MRQTLFYIPAELFGYPVFGIGLAFFALLFALLIAALVRYLRVRRFDEEMWNYLGLLVVGSAILIFVAPNVVEPTGFPIRGYGVCLLFAILAALALVLRLGRRKALSAEMIFSLCLWAVISGILGARLFYIIEYWPEIAVKDAAGQYDLPKTLYQIANIANGGLVVFGSIIGGGIGSLYFMIRNKMPVWTTFDVMAPAMMLGLAIGRIGCFLNGCCYGGVTDLSCGVVFPPGSPAHIHQIQHGETFMYGMIFKNTVQKQRSYVSVERVQPESQALQSGIQPGMFLQSIGSMIGHKPHRWEIRNVQELMELLHGLEIESPDLPVRFDLHHAGPGTPVKQFFIDPTPPIVRPVHPTQLYSSIAALTLCGVLLLLGRTTFFQQREGFVFVAFLILYGTVRFILEMIRTDEDSFLHTGMTVSQNVSLASILLGIVLGVWLWKRKAQEWQP